MSLRSKFLTQQVIVLASLLALGTAAVVSLVNARTLVREASEAREQLYRANTARSAVESYLNGVREDPPRSDVFLIREAARTLRGVVTAAADLRADQQPLYAAVAIERLEYAAASAEETPPQLEAAESHAANSLVPMQLVAQYYLTRTSLVQIAADALVRRMLVWVVAVAVVAGLAALAVGSWQYTGVMQPLTVLRDNVRRLAAGKFGEEIVVDGDREMNALADDLNHMAGELEGFYRDLSAQVQAKSRELVRSERLASVGFLAAGVAHEINNPLGIISGYAELALRKLSREPREGTESLVKSLEVIRDEAFRCKQITQRLLSLARGGNDDRVPVNMADVAVDVATLVRGLGKYGDRKVVVEPAPASLPAVRASTGEMKQVLLNLLVNALDATGSGNGVVKIATRVEGGQVVVDVADNGRGMSASTLERVFEPFFSDRPASQAKSQGERGVGLGLSISHAIVENHGGQLRAASEGMGKGSVFTVRLPADGPADDGRVE